MALLQALRHRSFALLWSGQTVSRLGDGLYRVALAWWVLEKTGSAEAMGAVLIFSFAPMLVFLLVGGVVVDRVPRVRVMLASDLLGAAVVGAVALLAFRDLLQVWHLYVASVLFGFASAFFRPAYTALVPEITPPELLPSANALTSLSGRLANVVGPALGGVIVGLGGTSMAFALDALSFLLSAACLVSLLGISVSPMTGRPPAGVVRDIREGLVLVLASPWLWVTIAIAALGNITTSGPMGVALPFLLKNQLGADARALGMVYAFASAGAVLGALWLGRATRLRRRGVAAYVAWMLGGLTTLVIGLGLSLPGVVVAVMINGVLFTAFSLIWTNTLQELVPRHLLGRVASIDYLGSYALLPVGFGVTGWATDRLGAPAVFLIGGAATALLAGLGLLHPAIRKLD